MSTTRTRVCFTSQRRDSGDELEVHVTMEKDEIQITALNLSVMVAVMSQQVITRVPARRTALDLRAVHVRFVVDKEIPVFPYQYHSISAPCISPVYHQDTRTCLHTYSTKQSSS
jgi:hypothetical protein